jgi:hypothetical protein
MSDQIPSASDDCDYCNYVKAVNSIVLKNNNFKLEIKIWKK